MKRTPTLSLPVAVVILAIIYIYFSTVFVFIDRWFGLMTSPGLMNAVVFTFIAVMCVFNYAVAISTDPGRVPSTYTPDVEDADHPIHEIKRKGGDLRYCQKCSHFKPPRAHHCRVCKRCVLRMDHHCIWISNCVGHTNYKVFFVFVVYAVTACIYSLVMLVGSIAADSQKDGIQSFDSFRIIYVMSGILLIPLSVALGILLGWHIYLILQNKTTIEYHEGVRAMWLAEKGGSIYRHPYDIGVYENLTTVRSYTSFSVVVWKIHVTAFQSHAQTVCANTFFFSLQIKRFLSEHDYIPSTLNTRSLIVMLICMYLLLDSIAKMSKTGAM